MTCIEEERVVNCEFICNQRSLGHFSLKVQFLCRYFVQNCKPIAQLELQYDFTSRRLQTPVGELCCRRREPMGDREQGSHISPL